MTDHGEARAASIAPVPTRRSCEQREGIVNSVFDALRRDGGRLSSCRRIITEVFVDAERHLTAEELAEEARRRDPEIHVSTVYRTLELLEERGIAYHVHLGHGPAQWHLTGSPHGHLTCTTCGAVIEADAHVVDGIIGQLRRATGFDVDAQHFAFTGRCAECREPNSGSTLGAGDSHAKARR